MKTTAIATFIATALYAFLGCSPPAPDPGPGASSPHEEQPTFVNQVWRVDESSGVPPGQLYVFLSEGTLVVASPNGKPSLGTWSRAAGGLTMVEEGVAYRCDILRLSATEFHIRSNNPGDPVEIRLVRADGSPPAPVSTQVDSSSRLGETRSCRKIC